MKKLHYVLAISLFCFMNYPLYAQVGIGTTSPDASSLLELNSTSQGILTPRMTTSQRNGISSPAEGLLVYDTDDNSFYYYSSGSWVALEGAMRRNNYKLIKSAADLADELTAGGGTTYQLASNTYYEVNGTIALAYPIDLNEAYISGLDANEDRLIITGSTIFSGSSGGSIRNLTLIVSGGSVFNLTGSGAETLLFQNSIVSGSGPTTDALGTISNFDIVFMNIINIGNLDDGITYNNIDNLLLSNVAWFESNAGTYETYTGTFNLIEKVSGFCKVPLGATGIDVSSNPTVDSGNIISTAFFGAGDYVDPYTSGSYPNHNFDSNWNVDSPGVPMESDAATVGYFSMANNTTVTNLSTNNVPVKIAGATVSSSLFRTSSSNNRIVYEGSGPREFVVICSGTLEHTVNNARIYNFYVYKNGVQVPAISSERRFSRNDVGSYSMTGVLSLERGDYIEIWVSINNVNNVPSCLVGNLSVVLK